MSSCSAYGELIDPGTVAEAVAASCAYPLLLPPLRRDYTFRSSDGATTRRSLRVTDGGVYDNLGVSPLMPGRSLAHTSQVYDLDYLIAVDAGHGRWDEHSPRGLLRIPLARSFDITHAKNQDGSRAQLHTLAATGQPQGFLHVYLGMRDRRLPVPMSDFVARREIADIGTNFRALTSTQLDLVSVRAEQLTRTLIDHWLPELTTLSTTARAAARRSQRAPVNSRPGR
ncbi:patatin-like phospholipase family protein [Pseudonocardia nematodicida]|uniref:Patatin-like phospholipase family protein n=1 Tax=Pseudonocardia nematodicida TaxID=1206997 RepID=A0ABV1KGV5_9PSEU